MDVRYNGAQIEGSNGFGSKRQVEVRKIHPHHLGDVAKTLEGDNLDEIVVQNKQGDQFVVFADELGSKKGIPAVGDTLTLNGEEMRVVRVDDEWAEKRVAAVSAVGAVAVGAFVGAKVGVGALATGGTGWVLGKLGLGSTAINGVMGGVTGFGIVRGVGSALDLFETQPSELYRISSPL